MNKIPIEVSLHLRYLYQDLGMRGRQLLDKYKQFSKASIYRHARKPIGNPVIDERKHNPGRPPKLSERDKRSIIRQVAVLRHYNFNSFSERVKKTIENFPIDIIDKTIESMDKRIGLIIKSKGQRTKY